MLSAQYRHMVVCYYGGKDLGLRGNLDTDYSDHGVIAVN